MEAVQNVTHFLPGLLCTPLLSKDMHPDSIFSLLHVGDVFTVLISVLMIEVREAVGQSDHTQPPRITGGTRGAGPGRTWSAIQRFREFSDENLCLQRNK